MAGSWSFLFLCLFTALQGTYQLTTTDTLATDGVLTEEMTAEYWSTSTVADITTTVPITTTTEIVTTTTVPVTTTTAATTTTVPVTTTTVATTTTVPVTTTTEIATTTTVPVRVAEITTAQSVTTTEQFTNSAHQNSQTTTVSATTPSGTFQNVQTTVPETTSSNSIEQTSANLGGPTLTANPTVVPQIGDSEQTYTSGGTTTVFEELQFKCLMNSVNPAWFYDVKWYVNNIQLPFSSIGVPAAQLPSTVLREQHWSSAFKLGMEVRCTIAARTSQNASPGPFRQSAQFFAGLRVLTPSVSTREGEAKPVYFRSTVPLACWKTNGITQRCFLQFEAMTRPSSYYCSYWATVSINDPASLRFCGPVIDSANWNGQLYMNVTGVHSNMYGYKITYVETTAIRHIPLLNTHRDVWDGVVLETIQVLVIKTYSYNRYSNPYCYAQNDPHMRTFDGRNYESQIEGIYVLYQHKQLPYSVHLMQRRCSDYRIHPVCIEGVAIQSGEDIVIMSLRYIRVQRRSYSYTRRVVVMITFGCFKSGIKIIRGSGYSPYEIYLPSGTRIKIGGSLSYVQVYPSPYDRGQTEGLCGYYDDDVCNDFLFRGGMTSNQSCPWPPATAEQQRYGFQPTDFVLSWRVQPSEYLFYGVPTHLPPNPPTIVSYQGSHCSCKLTGALQTWDGLTTQETLCSFHPPRIDCIYGRSQDVSFFYANTCQKKRETELFDLEDDDITIPDFDTDTSVNATYEVGWTEEEARTYCENFITNHPVYQPCKDIPNIDLESSVSACMLDIQLTGDTSWAKLALESFKGQCEEEVQKNETLWTSEGDGESILDQVVNSVCPLDCNSVGQCVNGSCKCDTGFGGMDCSIEMGVPPTNLTIPKSGLCDLSKKPCKATKVYGESFIESQNLTCRMAEGQVDREGIYMTGHTEDMKGIFINTYEVVCPLPTQVSGRETLAMKPWLSSYGVSISNNGQDFGEDATVLPYDPTCFDCHIEAITLICTLKVDFCYIENICRTSMSSDAGRPCYVCDPTQSKLDWTYNGDVTGSQRGGETCGSSILDAPWLLITVGTIMSFLVIR